ncbi:hypothetical protein [Pseudorhodoplanes sp.]|uniref:hypothetical protein n=1 Tax=Pseudorhodoplanes sp. TaxID=1934341 RepID=UPI0039198E1F
MMTPKVHTHRKPSPSALPAPVLERLLLSNVADLDEAFKDAEVRRTVEGFAPTYLLVALPKSSSTYCTQALSRILHGDVYKDIVVQDRFTPKDLQVAGIVNARDRVTVSQVHLVATGANLRILQNFKIPVVILLRNLFDVVVSLRDHMKTNPYFSSILIPNAYASLKDEDQLDYIIDTAVPWMVTFYVSWAQAMQRGDIDTKFVFYEDMIRDPVPFFQNACGTLGVSVSQADVNRALAQTEKSPATRFNVGKVGRGQSELSAAQIARIRRHADYYPGVSLEPLGL